MGMIQLFVLAVGLAMDAFAVSICKGLSIRELKLRHALVVGAWFGAFQALMPAIGWLLTGEMLELIHSGVPNIVCTQPFGCLPNHIVGKGMIRKLKDDYPNSNIVAIDYDPGATKINQENRIKLMLANAKALARQEAVHSREREPALV